MLAAPNAMAWVMTDPGANPHLRVGPGKHFFVPVIPVLGLCEHERFSLGSGGGFGIPQTTLQVLANLLLFGDSLSSAIARPRVVVGSLTPDTPDADDVWAEEGFGEEAYEALGCAPTRADREFGDFHSVRWHSLDQETEAVSDPRGEGSVYAG